MTEFVKIFQFEDNQDEHYEKSDISSKLKLLNPANELGNVSKKCRYFGISRKIFYQSKRNYEMYEEGALINSKPYPENPKLRTKTII